MTFSLKETAAAVRNKTGAGRFDLALVLGSGLGALAEEGEGGIGFPYEEIPGFPAATVPGHTGRLVSASLEGRRILIFAGRFHLYEGHSAHQAAFPVRLAHSLGCRGLLLTNAAGGIRPDFLPGDVMFIEDHLNFLGDNPLRGLTDNPFLDLSSLYEKRLYPSLEEAATGAGIRLHRGVLAALPGPSYETPAEIRMLRLLGADAVSMSTVPEAIMGKYLGMEVAGLSLIANPGAGLASRPLDHAEVLEAARLGAAAMSRLVRRLIATWEIPPVSCL